MISSKVFNVNYTVVISILVSKSMDEKLSCTPALPYLFHPYHVHPLFLHLLSYFKKDAYVQHDLFHLNTKYSLSLCDTSR